MSCQRCAFVWAQNKIVQYIVTDLTNAATGVLTVRIVHNNIKSLPARDIWSLFEYEMAGRSHESYENCQLIEVQCVF